MSLFVNYDLLINVETKEVDKKIYLCRIGRMDRFHEKGLVINFIDSNKTMTFVKDLEKHFGHKICKLNANNIEEIEKLDQEYCVL
jgi:ATP-dependent RNA helicase DDX19/DBP5